MKMQSRNFRDDSMVGVLRFATVLGAILLTACGGSGDGVSIGTGQDADPVVIDFPIAYVKAPVPVDDQGVFAQDDLRELITFNFGADLYIRDRASPSAISVNVTGDITNGLGAIQDLEMAYDGSAVIFAMRTPIDINLDVDENGVYLISSIYMMDLENQRKKPIFVGKINSPYFILGGWNSQYDVLAYIEWQKSNDLEIYSLMISNSDGLSSVKIDETRRDISDHHKEIPFYGWKIIN